MFVSDIHSFFAKQDRKAVEDNLKKIFPDKGTKDIRVIRIKMLHNFAKYLVDFFCFNKLNMKYIQKNIRIENKEHIDKALARGKGVIAITAHLGNWELGGVVLSLLGYPLSAVALPHKDWRVDKFFNSQRQSKGLKIIPLGKAVMQCLRVLKSNGVVALVGDRDFTEKGIIIDFFGKPTFFPEGPAAFALKTGAGIVPGFMIRNTDDTFTLRFEKPLEINPTGNKDENLNKLILEYKSIFENYIRRYPDQWYMFKRFWIT